MIFEFIIYGICLAALSVGSYTDLKTREVPDWVNYGLIITGFGLNIMLSAITNEWSFAVNSVIGFVVMFSISYAMFYTGQWGGGDSKMLMGLGAMLGLDISFKNIFIVHFFVNMLIFGAIYGLIFSFYIAAKNFTRFKIGFKKLSSGEGFKNYRRYMLIAVFILLAAGMLMEVYQQKLLWLAFALSIMMLFYLVFFIKVIEKTCMLRLVEPSKLTEGDWIAKNVVVNGKLITGPKDLGIEKKNIRKLIELYRRNKVKRVLVKEGIPFVPSFLIAFIMTLFYGNIILLFV